MRSRIGSGSAWAAAAIVAACAAPPKDALAVAGADPGIAAGLDVVLRRCADQGPGREVAIAYVDLATGARHAVHGDLVMHAASTMKVPVMVELYRRIDRGELALAAEVVLVNRFRSIVDGSMFSVDPADDSDADLYARIGEPVAIGELLTRMIRRSSNLATNVLIDLLDPAAVQRTCEALGTTRMRVLRGVEDTLAYRAGRNNVTTADDLATVLAAIATGRAASTAACAQMLDVLLGQEFNDLIPAGLPPATRVAHKTGQITAIHHDAAIVFSGGEPAYVLVVLTRGFEDPSASAAVVAGVARAVHRARSQLPNRP